MMPQLFRAGLSIRPPDYPDIDGDRGVWTLGTVVAVTLCALGGWLFGAALLHGAVWCVAVLAVWVGAL